jgi:hypothetical protein
MSDAGVAGKLRAQRLPRWTRQEILVLIEGKRVVERSGRGRGRGRDRGGGADGGGGTAAAEPTKWAAVAAYCRRHGVDRGPVQCRKRWSNLAGDYKKVREWESGKGAAGEPSSSFWAMRNDARRERRLPGFFDREVYDVLEGRGAGGNNNAAEAAPRVDLDDADDGKEREKPVRDDGGAKPAGDGLFSSSSDENGDDNDEAATPTPPSLTPALPPMPVLVPVSGESRDAAYSPYSFRMEQLSCTSPSFLMSWAAASLSFLDVAAHLSRSRRSGRFCSCFSFFTMEFCSS